MNNFFNQFFQRQVPGINKITEAWNRSIFKEMVEQQQALTVPFEQLLVSAIDSETTGFHPEMGDEMLSLAAVHWKEKVIGDPFHSYIQIEKSLPPHISELTGIQMEDLVGAPPIEQVLPSFFQYVGSTVLIGFYVGHDTSFINYYLWKKFRKRITHRVLELKKVTDFLHPEWVHATFDDLCETYCIQNTGRHTAIGDALATAELWGNLIYELKEKGIDHLLHLYEQLSIDRKHQK
jgi:DNA polymerase-3 subunit epsilon